MFSAGMDKDLALQMFKSADLDGSGAMDISEFMVFFGVMYGKFI
jgi:hypothetical protein